MNFKINTSICLEKHTTTFLRFVLIICIMLNHYAGKVESIWLYPFLIGGYSAVALFFFLSGYGNFKSIDRKPLSSIWLLKRFGHIGFSFIIVLLINFAFLAIVSNIGNSFFSYLFSLSIPGQTLWYVKVQLLLYIIFTLTFSFKASNETKSFFTILIVIVYIILLIGLDVEPYWYMTCVFFPFGIYFALYENKIFKIIYKRIRPLSIVLGIICFILFGVQFLFGDAGIGLAMDFLYEIFISLFVITILMQINIKSKIMEKIGNSSFELYMTHLVVLNILDYFCIDLTRIYVLFVWFISSILLGVCVNTICRILLDQMILHIRIKR